MFITMEQYEKARPLCEMVYKVRKEILGPKHPKSLNIANLYGWLCALQGDYDLACTLTLEAITGRVEILGEDHLTTLDSYIGYALALFWKGDCVEAETILLNAIPKQEAVMGSRHPEVIENKWHYVQLLASTNRVAQAIQQGEELLQHCSETPRKKHSLQPEIALYILRWLWGGEKRDIALTKGKIFLLHPDICSPQLKLEHGTHLCQSHDPAGIDILTEVLPMLNDQDKSICMKRIETYKKAIFGTNPSDTFSKPQ